MFDSVERRLLSHVSKIFRYNPLFSEIISGLAGRIGDSADSRRESCLFRLCNVVQLLRGICAIESSLARS
jgi:hypothetical protein